MNDYMYMYSVQFDIKSSRPQYSEKVLLLEDDHKAHILISFIILGVNL